MKETAHLASDDLAALAVSGEDEPAHVADCEQCRMELAEFREVVARLTALPQPPARLLDAAKAYYRKRRNLDALIERLAEDPALRADLRADPRAVLRRAGLDPTPELIEALSETERESGVVSERIAAKLFWG